MKEDSSKLYFYCILEYNYLNMIGYNEKTEKEFLKEINKIFPQRWHSYYSIDKRIKYLSTALKEKKNLNEVVGYIFE